MSDCRDERSVKRARCGDTPGLAEDEVVGYSEDGEGLRVRSCALRCRCHSLYSLLPIAFPPRVPPQVEFISEDECAFLYDEIFVRQEYFKHGNASCSVASGHLPVPASPKLAEGCACPLRR